MSDPQPTLEQALSSTSRIERELGRGRMAVVSLVAILASTASAQVPYEGCTDRKGRPIIGIVSDSLSYAVSLSP